MYSINQPQIVEEDSDDEKYDSNLKKFILDEDEIAGQPPSQWQRKPRTNKHSQLKQASSLEESESKQPEPNIFNMNVQERLGQIMKESLAKKDHQPKFRKSPSQEEKQIQQVSPPTQMLKTTNDARTKFPVVEQKNTAIKQTQVKQWPQQPSQQQKQPYSQEYQQQQPNQFSEQRRSSSQRMKCLSHKQEVIYICCVSQWHCEGLCMDCVPEHTEWHSKNRSQINLKKFDQMKSECIEKCNKLSDELEKRKVGVINLIQEEYQDQNIINLYNWRQQTIEIVEKYFDTLQQNYFNKVEQIQISVKKKLEVVAQEIEKVQNDLKSFEEDLEEQEGYLKGMANTSRINVEGYVKDLEEEVKRIYAEGEMAEEFKLNEGMLKYLEDNLGRLVLEKEKKKEKEREKRAVVKQKSRRCECGETMTYVSEFKKSMECQKCGKIRKG